MSDKEYKQRVGTRAKVMHGTAKMTAGGLKKKHLKYNKHMKIVSRKASTSAKKSKNLQKAGYFTKKGQFGAYRKMGRNRKVMRGGGFVEGEKEAAKNALKESGLVVSDEYMNNLEIGFQEYRKRKGGEKEFGSQMFLDWAIPKIVGDLNNAPDANNNKYPENAAKVDNAEGNEDKAHKNIRVKKAINIIKEALGKKYIEQPDRVNKLFMNRYKLDIDADSDQFIPAHDFFMFVEALQNEKKEHIVNWDNVTHPTPSPADHRINVAHGERGNTVGHIISAD